MNTNGNTNPVPKDAIEILTASIWNQTLVGWDVSIHHECHGTIVQRVTSHADLAETIEDCNHWGRTYRVHPLRK